MLSSGFGVHRHQRRLGRVGLALLGCTLAATAALVVPASAHSGNPDAVHFRPGSEDLGDPLAPGLGNGGYLVDNYDITLHYAPAAGMLVGDTIITAKATENLSRFDLDFALPATSVTVNGVAATSKTVPGPPYSYSSDLRVTPAAGIRAGSALRIEVTYAAKPGSVKLAHESSWQVTPTGIACWNEPIAASEWWYPGNDYPSDKATYDVTVTVPKAYTVVTNGTLAGRSVHGADATEHWHSDNPMASYLAGLFIGKYDVVRGTALGDVPTYTAYESGGGAIMQRARRDVSQTPQVLQFLQSKWGAFPFASAGGVVYRYLYPTAFEMQNRPIYASGLWENDAHDMWAVVHENAHQWFGDSVTASRWRHFWLAEGFATYSEWLWSQATGEGTAEQLFLSIYGSYPKTDTFWRQSVVKPAYALPIQAYERGGMTLQALRNRVGSSTFFAIMRGWAQTHRGTSQSTASFVTYAESMTSVDLSRFFQVWLYSTHRPAPTEADGFPSSARAALARGGVAMPASLPEIRRSDSILAANGQ
jgi:aminopeptidase N